MPKYIDAEKIQLKYEFGMVSDEGIICIPMRDVKKSIDATPTADVVEVVRCKDCKSFMEYSDAHKRAVERADGDCFLRLTHSCDEQFIACRYNDFCSYGERKDT